MILLESLCGSVHDILECFFFPFDNHNIMSFTLNEAE